MAGSNITYESKLTLSLAASGGTKLIPMEGKTKLGLQLTGPASSPDADGTIQFRPDIYGRDGANELVGTADPEALAVQPTSFSP